MGKAKDVHHNADRLIIDSYKATMEGLGIYYGSAFEIVLHDLTDLDHSIVKIVNGFHSDRKEGGPITDFGLSMLEALDRSNPGHCVTYFAKSKYGRPIKSTTIAIFGEQNKAIGLLCINLYLDSPIMSLLDFVSEQPKSFIAENFIDNSEDLIYRTFEKVRSEVEKDGSVMVSQKNRKIIALLYHQGIFRLKESVKIVSKELDLTRNTVYSHIRSLDGK